MFNDVKHSHAAFIVCVIAISVIPKILMFSTKVIEPFTYSIIALATDTQAFGHIKVNPYTIQGYWQNHANFLSNRAAIVSFLTILSSITGLSPSIVASFPLTGFMLVILSYLLGRELDGQFTGIAFAVTIGYSWYPTLTITNISYQSYGYLLQFIIIFILVRCCVRKEKWSRKDILVICLLFFVLYQTYYSIEFTTSALFILIAAFSFILKRFSKIDAKLFSGISFLALWSIIIFWGFDTVAYSFAGTASLSLFVSSLLNYFSYVRSVIYGERETFQEYRPYTNPFRKYISLCSSVLVWSVIALSVILYLNELRQRKGSKRLTKKENTIHIIIFSLLGVFVLRTLIYGLLGKIATGWIYTELVAIVAAQIWLSSKSRPILKYVIPFILIGLTISGFSLIWTDQTLSFVGANYPPLVNPCADWIADNVYSGRLVSTNQISAQVFSVIAKSGKANKISVNQFGRDVKNLTICGTRLRLLLKSRGYDYMLILKLFESQPLFGGFWGPYVPPLRNKIQNFCNYTGFSRIYDDGMSFLYGLSYK